MVDNRFNSVLYNFLIKLVVILFFFEMVIEDIIIFRSLLISQIVCILFLGYFLWEYKQTMLEIFFLIFIGLLITSFILDSNYIYELVDGFRFFDLSIDPKPLSEFLVWNAFWSYYGILVAFSIFSQAFITYFFIKQEEDRRSKYRLMGKTKIMNNNEELGYWEWFLTNIDLKKGILLVVTTIGYAIYEEIVYRFLLMNSFYGIESESAYVTVIGFVFIFYLLNIRFFTHSQFKKHDYVKSKMLNTLLVIVVVSVIAIGFFTDLYEITFYVVLIVSALIFGFAHYDNGGWIFTVTTTFAGLLFGLVFNTYGIYASSFIHAFWNLIIIFQMYFQIRSSKLE